MPEIKLSTVTDELTKAVKDAVYISVGFGVLAVQRLQVQRQELKASIERQLGAGQEKVDGGVKNLHQQLSTLEARLTALEERLDAGLDQVQAKLPAPAADVMRQAREAAKQARTQMRDLVKRADAPADSSAA